MISRLRNIGPKSEAMLARAGIRSVRELQRLGSVRAYVMAKRSGADVSLNLLWAIEGALTNRPWQEVAKNDRLALLLQLEQEEARASCSNRSSSGRVAGPAGRRRST